MTGSTAVGAPTVALTSAQTLASTKDASRTPWIVAAVLLAVVAVAGIGAAIHFAGAARRSDSPPSTVTVTPPSTAAAPTVEAPAPPPTASTNDVPESTSNHTADSSSSATPARDLARQSQQTDSAPTAAIKKEGKPPAGAAINAAPPAAIPTTGTSPAVSASSSPTSTSAVTSSAAASTTTSSAASADRPCEQIRQAFWTPDLSLAAPERAMVFPPIASFLSSRARRSLRPRSALCRPSILRCWRTAAAKRHTSARDRDPRAGRPIRIRRLRINQLQVKFPDPRGSIGKPCTGLPG